MAKMFYSLDEAADKLNVSEGEIRKMVSTGQIQEFRDGEKLLFKVEQINLLAGEGEEEEELIPLAEPVDEPDEEAGGVPLVEDDSGLDIEGGSSIGLHDSSQGYSPESSGISVFDADDVDTADPSELTHISETAGAEELNFETVGSGSGLLDLTQESDDTSLGAELLDEIYPGEDAVDVPASASGLFESEEGADADHGAMPVMAMAAAEPLDRVWSGASMGLLFGALVALVVGVIVVVTALLGASPAIVPMISDMNAMLMYGGGLVGLMILLAVVGAVIGKKS